MKTPYDMIDTSGYPDMELVIQILYHSTDYKSKYAMWKLHC